MTPENQRDEDLKLEGEAYKLLRMSETEDLMPPFRALPSPSEEWIFWKAKTICRWVSALRQSWEREKSTLETELRKAEGAIRTHADSINALMKEKAGLEERVRVLEQRLAHNANSVPGSKESYMAQVESQQNEISRLKAENDRLAKRNNDLERAHDLIRLAFKGVISRNLKEFEGGEYIVILHTLERKVDRLTSALAMAHEALRYYARCVPCGGTGKTWEHDASCGDNENGDCIADHPKNKVCRGCKGKGNHCLEILSDPTGQAAHERWKRMWEVVTYANTVRNDILIPETDDQVEMSCQCKAWVDGLLERLQTLEALEAKGETACLCNYPVRKCPKHPDKTWPII